MTENPFVNLLAIIEALPRPVADNEPLRNHLPGVWPTVGDLRALVRPNEREPTPYLTWAKDLVVDYDCVHFYKDFEFAAFEAAPTDLVVYERGVRGPAATFKPAPHTDPGTFCMFCVNYPGSHAPMNQKEFLEFVKATEARNKG